MPANPTALNESITVFVIDDAGTTYRLLLVPGPRPAEDVRIEPPAARSTQALQASAFQRRVKLMMLAMAGGRGHRSCRTRRSTLSCRSGRRLY
ncbi:type-F conjugative transfer system secretin TraK [Burkholderia cenocepacia]|uniref:type-F conjugative transfer system secretin TraK n=1 Tax=Burkholderia cenocepacia TaxID=95486 RepID=UPI0021AFE09E|nr:type-F conjugative transfer system secretin TraK [Burkholderia cenocepacia]